MYSSFNPQQALIHSVSQGAEQCTLGVHWNIGEFKLNQSLKYGKRKDSPKNISNFFTDSSILFEKNAMLQK